MELLKKLHAIKKLIKSYLAQEIKVTSVLQVKVPGEQVFNFLSIPENWIFLELHGIHNIHYDRGLWQFESRRGIGWMHLRQNPSNLILEYAMLFLHEDVYEVVISIVNHGRECMTLISITKPEKMPVEYFEYRLQELDRSFAQLKHLLELNGDQK